MAKRRSIWDEEKIKSKINEGYGSGKGKDYKPWLETYSLSSKGISSRQPGWKSNRVCHFLSKNELNYFYLLEWSDVVVDIREQYPLLQLDETFKIAEELGIEHPVDVKTKNPYVLTTDFLITVKIDGKEKDIARTIKMADDLEDMRVLQKFEIERRYWEKRNTDWRIVTPKDIPKAWVENIEWVYFHHNIEPTKELEVKELLAIGEVLKSSLEENDSTLGQVVRSLDKEMNLETGTCLTLLRHLIAKKEIVLDMNKKIGVTARTNEIIKIVRRDSRVKVI